MSPSLQGEASICQTSVETSEFRPDRTCGVRLSGRRKSRKAEAGDPLPRAADVMLYAPVLPGRTAIIRVLIKPQLPSPVNARPASP